MNTAVNFNNPSAPTLFKGELPVRYPELTNETLNFRLKKILDDEKLLQNEIKSRKSTCKKYGRLATLTNSVEYTLILADIVIGTLAATVPAVGIVVSTAAFSGVGLISGLAKMIQGKLYEKKMKHYKLSVVAHTTLSNLHHKISKAMVDAQISHEEFEDIQTIMNEWKNNPVLAPKLHQSTLNTETIELLRQQAAEKAQQDLLDKLKKISVDQKNK